MADAYWSYGSSRYQAPLAPAPAPVKRPRSDYGEFPGGPEYIGYYPRDEERVVHRAVREPENLGAPYDPYLRNRGGGTDSRTVEYGSRRLEKPLPPDATSTLYVEGLPASCTRREVSHIFRPFSGFQEVRLVNKESKHPGGDTWVLCFADFSSPSQAAVALDCLQGYKFDEHERDSTILKMQFSRFPGAKSGSGPRRRR